MYHILLLPYSEMVCPIISIVRPIISIVKIDIKKQLNIIKT